MKQPKNRVAISEYVGGEYFTSIILMSYWVENNVEIANGTTKRTALKAAIKRLHRLAADAEKMLEKL